MTTGDQTSGGKCLIFCRTYMYDDMNMVYDFELAKHGVLFLPDNHHEIKLYGSNLCSCEKFDARTSNSV